MVVVENVNHKDINSNVNIISLGNNTVQALTEILYLFNNSYTISSCFINEYRSFNGFNSLVDCGDYTISDSILRRSAAQTVIPSLYLYKDPRLISSIIPALNGKILGSSTTLPTIAGTLYSLDIKVNLDTNITNETVNRILKNMMLSSNLIEYTEDVCIPSAALLGTEKSIILGSETVVYHDTENNATHICIRVFFDETAGMAIRSLRILQYI